MTPATTPPVPIFPEHAGTRRFTSDEYHRLIDAGVLGPDDRVERLDGYIVLLMDRLRQPPADGPFPEWRWLRRWSLAEFHRMIDLGVLGPDEKLELLDGYLVLKMPQSKSHRAAIMRLSAFVPGRLPPGWALFTQLPVVVGGRQPEPDGLIVRGTALDYDDRDPSEADFGIIIEVVGTTLDLDRRAKGRFYARAGIPVYWIVYVEDRQVEVYTDPDPAATPAAYRTRTDYRPGQDVPVVLDGIAVAVIPAADLLP